MEMPHEMTTLSSVLEKLRLKKYDTELRWVEGGFTAGKGKIYQPSDLEIIKIYRFEGITDPGDMSILYLIQGNDGLIGYSLDAYGAYSDHDNEEGYDNFSSVYYHNAIMNSKCCSRYEQVVMKVLA